MKRLFIATQITFNHSLNELITRLKSGCRFDQVTWVEQDIPHLTLRFLGKTPDTQIPELKQILEDITADTTSFQMEIDKLGVFGSRYAPSVVWLGFKEFALYKQLFEKLEKRLTTVGFEPAYGNFVPHITLGRIKKIDNKKRFWELIENNPIVTPQVLQMEELNLIQSKLLSHGPEYRVLGSYKLNV